MSRRKRRHSSNAATVTLLALLLCFAAMLVFFLSLLSFVATRKLTELILRCLLPNVDDVRLKERRIAGSVAYLLHVGVVGSVGLLTIYPLTFLVIGVVLPVLGMVLFPYWGWVRELPANLTRIRRKKLSRNRGLDPYLWRKARQSCFTTKGRRCLIGLNGCTRKATQIDHIFPLAKGGAKYDLANLQPSCRFCNLSKGTKLMSELAFRRWFSVSR